MEYMSIAKRQQSGIYQIAGCRCFALKNVFRKSAEQEECGKIRLGQDGYPVKVTKYE